MDGLGLRGQFDLTVSAPKKFIQAYVGLVPVSSIHYCIYTFGLLTWWSSTATIEKQS
jgi:hypothetical protein